MFPTALADAFCGCTSLTTLDLSLASTTVGAYAFCGATSLKNLILPDDLTTVAEGLFFGCTSLIELNVPAGVIRIQNYAACGCTALVKVTLPSTLTTIGNYSFCCSAGSNTRIGIAPAQLLRLLRARLAALGGSVLPGGRSRPTDGLATASGARTGRLLKPPIPHAQLCFFYSQLCFFFFSSQVAALF